MGTATLPWLLGLFASATDRRPAGWDPFLQRRLAASAFPRSPNYFEACPDGPGGRCLGLLPPGSGFYTLGGGSTNATCKINAGAASSWTPNAANPSVPCPFGFHWRGSKEGGKEGGVIASAEVDSRGFRSADTPNLYVGLQENLPVPPVFGGLSAKNATMCPPLSTVAAVSFKMRATVCYGTGNPTGNGFGRVAFYIGFWNTALGEGRSISIDVFTFLNQPWRPTLPIRRPAPFVDDGNALHLDGAAFGLVPNGTEPTHDTSADCSLRVEQAPWVALDVQIPLLLEKLVGMGLLKETMLEGALLTGGIVVGPETWGKHRTVAEVANRTIWVAKLDDDDLPLAQGLPAEELSLRCSLNGWLSRDGCVCTTPWAGHACNEISQPAHLRGGAFYRSVLPPSTFVARCDPGQLHDCTDAMSEALQHTGSVFVPRLAAPGGQSVPWRIRGMAFGLHQRVVFEAGVVVEALKNSSYIFGCKPVADLATAIDSANLTIVGYDATWQMWRDEYVRKCKHSEFRMGLFINGGEDVSLAGVTIRESGGDGITVASTIGKNKAGATRRLLIRDVVLDRNYRQGMSVISAADMLVLNTTFSNTNGTSPQHGVDLEPDSSTDPSNPLRLENLTFRDCRAINNSGAGFGGYLLHAVSSVTIRFENCSISGGHSGWWFSTVSAKGAITVSGGSVEGTATHGVALLDKLLGALPVTFEGHRISHVAIAENKTCVGSNPQKYCPPGSSNAPVALYYRDGQTKFSEGGVHFAGCSVTDDRPRPWLELIGVPTPKYPQELGWWDVGLADVAVRYERLGRAKCAGAAAFCQPSCTDGVGNRSQVVAMANVSCECS